MSLERLAWRREALLLCLVAMDALCLAPWANLLVGSAAEPAHRVPVVALFALLLATLMAARALEASHLGLGVQRVLCGALAIVTGVALGGLFLYREYPFAELDWLLAWAADLPHAEGGASIVLMGVALWAWWRGIGLAQSRLESDEVGLYFRVGIVAWLWFHILGLFAGTDQPTAWLLLYFALGLMAVGLARVEDAQRGRGAIRSPFAGSWLMILAGGAAAVVGAGMVATAAVAWASGGVFWQVLVPIAGLLNRLLLAALTLVGLLLAPLLEWLVGALRGTMALLAQQAPTVPTPTAVPTPEAPAAASPPPGVQAVLWALAALAFLALGALIAVQMRRRRAEEPVEGPVVLAWEAAPGERGAGPGGALARLRERLAAALGALQPGGYSLGSVRELYAALQRLAARHGMAREEAQTPYEYERRLDGAWPEAGSEVEAITDAYVRAHYGQREISAEELAALRAAWERLRQTLEGGPSRPATH